MKYFSCIIIFLFLGKCMLSQEFKRGNNWVIGFAPAIYFNFNNGIAFNTFQQLNGLLEGGSCISNKNGDFIFYSNGYVIGDKYGYNMQNGYNINCPYGTVLSDQLGGGSKFDQTSIILPKKGNQYYVFSTGMSDVVANEWIQNSIFLGFDVFNYSVVDMDSNNGKGKVIDKNHVLLDSQKYAQCALTAVRHGNGKDWWLVKADCWKHQYQLFWVQEDTILGPYYQTIPDTANFCANNVQLYFSEDGTKFASSIYSTYDGVIVNKFNRVDVYDFNRCTGQISFRNYYEAPVDSVGYPNQDGKAGIQFSPNGNLLYMSTYYNIFQFDINDTNKHNSIAIHGPDTTLAEFAWYDLLANGPDGKMYIGNYNATQHYMSYIDSPNVRGLGCHFVGHGIWQPYTNLYNPPNMPNYGLVSVDTVHGCYPASLPNPPKEGEEGEVVVYPNPANTIINVRCSMSVDKNAPIELYNSIGQCVLHSTYNIQHTTFQIDVSHLPKGLYYLKVGNMCKKVVVE